MRRSNRWLVLQQRLWLSSLLLSYASGLCDGYHKSCSFGLCIRSCFVMLRSGLRMYVKYVPLVPALWLLCWPFCSFIVTRHAKYTKAHCMIYSMWILTTMSIFVMWMIHSVLRHMCNAIFMSIFVIWLCILCVGELLKDICDMINQLLLTYTNMPSVETIAGWLVLSELQVHYLNFL